MYLYYSIVSNQGDIQQKPHLSLGGYIAKNKVSNGILNNLFSDISQLTISNYNQNTYIALYLKNELGVDCENIRLYFEYPEDCYSKLRVAPVSPVLDNKGFYQIEHVETPNSKPLFGEFYEANGLDNAINLFNLGNGQMIGLWFERELLMDFIKNDQSLVYEVDPSLPGRYKERVLGKEDDIKINIVWD